MTSKYSMKIYLMTDLFDIININIFLFNVININIFLFLVSQPQDTLIWYARTVFFCGWNKYTID